MLCTPHKRKMERNKKEFVQAFYFNLNIPLKYLTLYHGAVRICKSVVCLYYHRTESKPIKHLIFIYKLETTL